MQSNINKSSFEPNTLVNNAVNIMDIINKLKKQNYSISRDTPPVEITIDMLKMALDCEDLRSQPSISKEALWNVFYINNFKKNKFGFFIDPLDKITDPTMKIPIIRELSNEDIKNLPPILPYDAKTNPLLKFMDA